MTEQLYQGGEWFAVKDRPPEQLSDWAQEGIRRHDEARKRAKAFAADPANTEALDIIREVLDGNPLHREPGLDYEEPRDLYAERLAFRQADQEALRKLAAESRPPVRKPEVLTLRERLARPQPPVQWSIEGWQPAGSRVLVAAQYKAGKTTLVGNLSRSLVDGDPFLDSHTVAAVDKTVGVIDLEMNEHQLDGWYAD